MSRVLAFVVALIATLGVSQSCSALDGETGDAYVQAVHHTEGRNGTDFTITVKFKQTGTFYVAAGFAKNNRMHKGTFSRTQYYKVTQVSGDAGDQVSVTVRDVPTPPLNRTYSAGVYEDEEDIKTGG